MLLFTYNNVILALFLSNCNSLQSLPCFVPYILVNLCLYNSLSNLLIIKIIPSSLQKCSVRTIKKKNLYFLKITWSAGEGFEFSIAVAAVCLTFTDSAIDWV